MDRYADLTKCVRVEVHHRQRKALCMSAVMLAVDDVADATDAHAEDQWRAGYVSQPSDVQPLAPGVDGARDRTQHDRAIDRQPAFIDLQNRDRVSGVEVPLVDDVEKTRTDDGADDAPHRHREGV